MAAKSGTHGRIGSNPVRLRTSICCLVYPRSRPMRGHPPSADSYHYRTLEAASWQWNSSRQGATTPMQWRKHDRLGPDSRGAPDPTPKVRSLRAAARQEELARIQRDRRNADQLLRAIEQLGERLAYRLERNLLSSVHAGRGAAHHVGGLIDPVDPVEIRRLCRMRRRFHLAPHREPTNVLDLELDATAVVSPELPRLLHARRPGRIGADVLLHICLGELEGPVGTGNVARIRREPGENHADRGVCSRPLRREVQRGKRNEVLCLAVRTLHHDRLDEDYDQIGALGRACAERARLPSPGYELLQGCVRHFECHDRTYRCVS